MGGGPGWALRVRPADSLPDPQGPSLAQDGPILGPKGPILGPKGPILGPKGPIGDTKGALLGTYVFLEK